MFESNFQRVVTRLLSDLGGPFSKKVLNCIETGNVVGVRQLIVDPASYTDAEEFFRDYQCVELLKKIDLPANVKELTQRAEDVFWECESACCLTNARMNGPLNNYYGEFEAPGSVIDLIDTCKTFIRRVLGPVPDELSPSFGKGATYSTRAPLTTVPDKMTERPCVTPACYDLIRPFYERTAWARAARGYDTSLIAPVDFVRGNRFTTIAKDLSKRRGICVEPDLNVSFQLPVGRLLKSKLLRVGIDLRGDPTKGPTTGQMLHRSLAERGSRDGDLATIDLSNASDTIARRLVELLLPPAWFELLDALRSKTTEISGKRVFLEKFSSMGNGFTFELETLLFCAFAHAAGGKIGVDSFVYGDDIIVPSDVAQRLIKILVFFGFTPNAKKTFLTGPFRESCGGDFFNGKAVRPHYIKKLPEAPEDWIGLANGLRLAGFAPENVVRWYRFKGAWESALSCLPSRIRRLRGPSILGDAVIHDDSWRTVLIDGVFHVRAYVPVINALSWHHFRPNVQFAAFLYGVPSEGPIPRGNVGGYMEKLIPCSCM